MPPDKRTGRPSPGNRPATYTNTHPERTAPGPRSVATLPVAWHEVAEYESAAAYADGWVAGWTAAHRAMRNAIAEATQGLPHDAAEVVRQLVRVWDR